MTMDKKLHEDIMLEAIKFAYKGMNSGARGPFGAIIADAEGKVFARAYNEVLKRKDPSCHAEIMAIRQMKETDLSAYNIYATGYPCPMCLSAILWARIPRLYYCNSYEMATAIGFDDSLFMESLGEIYQCSPKFAVESKTDLLSIKNIPLAEGKELYRDWGKIEEPGSY